MRSHTIKNGHHQRSPLSNPPLSTSSPAPIMTSQLPTSHGNSSSPVSHIASREEGAPRGLRRTSRQVSRLLSFPNLRNMSSLSSVRKLYSTVMAKPGGAEGSTSAENTDTDADQVDENGLFRDFNDIHNNEALREAAPISDAGETPRQPPRQTSIPGSHAPVQSPVRSSHARPSRFSRLKSRIQAFRDEITKRLILFRRSSRIPILGQVQQPIVEQSIIKYAVMICFPPSFIPRSPTPMVFSSRPAPQRSQAALVLVNPQTTYEDFLAHVHEIIQNESFQVLTSTESAFTTEISVCFSDEIHDWKRTLRIANTIELQLSLRYMEMSGWKRSDWFEVCMKGGKAAESRAGEFVGEIERRSESIYSRRTNGEMMTDVEFAVPGMTPVPKLQFGADGFLRGRQ